MRNKVYLWSYIALTALYAGLSLGLPSDPEVLQKYNLTQSHAHLINLFIVVPLILVWVAALYGFLRFKSYSKTIRNTSEGKAFNRLASGLAILAFSLPALACMTSIINYVNWHEPGLKPTLTILKNYSNLVFPVFAFWQIYLGAEDLINTLKKKVTIRTSNRAILGLILLTSLYIWLLTTRTYGPSGADIAYYMPTWLIITTIAIPYLFMWYKGMQAAFYINAYQNKIRGKIYKRSLQYLAQGIIAIIILSICIQLIATTSVRLTRLKITPLLAIVYVLVALYAVGYGLVAKGANKLKLIEEV